MKLDRGPSQLPLHGLTPSLRVQPGPSNIDSSLRLYRELIEHRSGGVDVIWLTTDAPVLYREIRTSPCTD